MTDHAKRATATDDAGRTRGHRREKILDALHLVVIGAALLTGFVLIPAGGVWFLSWQGGVAWSPHSTSMRPPHTKAQAHALVAKYGTAIVDVSGDNNDWAYTAKVTAHGSSGWVFKAGHPQTMCLYVDQHTGVRLGATDRGWVLLTGRDTPCGSYTDHNYYQLDSSGQWTWHSTPRPPKETPKPW